MPQAGRESARPALFSAANQVGRGMLRVMPKVGEAEPVDVTTPPAVLADGAELAKPLPCPLCEYDLRGLPSGRCPECGHRFDAWELRTAQVARERDLANRPIQWLVEYLPPEWRFAWAPYLITPLATWRALWFWKRLRPHMAIRPGRLLAYNFLVIVAALALLAAVNEAEPLLRRATGSWRAFNDSGGSRYTTSFGRLFAVHGLLVGVVVLWPRLTLAALLSFRISLRQARIDTRHVWRCVSYAGDVVLWAGPMLLACDLFVLVGILPDDLLGETGYQNLYYWLTVPTFTAASAIVGIFWFRLSIAYRRYLAFPHAIVTVAATQMIVVLIALLLSIYLVWL